jgi:hypothetical protein
MLHDEMGIGSIRRRTRNMRKAGEMGGREAKIEHEMGGEEAKKPLRLGSRRPQLGPRTPSAEIIATPPVASILVAYVSLCFGTRRENHTRI